MVFFSNFYLKWLILNWKISCYKNAEYADETYWFLRNKKGDNISEKLFTE